MSEHCEIATKRVRRLNLTMSEGSDGRSLSLNATASCSQMFSEHSEQHELDGLGESNQETSTEIVLAFQLKRSYIENPK